MKLRKDSAYTNGVIAVKEKKLLKDKLAKMCSMSGEDALRLLAESGFGGGSEPEEMVLADEREIDLFIREYAPSKDVEEYLLAPRDFHNAKALVKARHLELDDKPLLGSDGQFSADEIAKAMEAGDTVKLGKELHEAIKAAKALLEKEEPAGAEVGFVFDKALFAYLLRVLKKYGVCKKLLIRRLDMTNLLTYFRSQSKEEAEKFFIEGGSLSKEKLSCVFAAEGAALKAFEKSPYKEYVKKLTAAREGEQPFTEAEKMLESFEVDFFSQKPYELSGQGTFLYYVFRRRTENENVRIVLVCLKAGLSEAEIRKRLRGNV